MSKTMITLLTASSLFAFGSVQAADPATPMEKPAVESAAPTKTAKPAKPAQTKKVAKQKKSKQSSAKKAEGAVAK